MSASLKRAHSVAISLSASQESKKHKSDAEFLAECKKAKEAINPAAAAVSESKEAEADAEPDESGYESPRVTTPQRKLTAEQRAAEERKESSARGSSAFKQAIATAAFTSIRENKVDWINASGYAFAQPDGETRLNTRLNRKAAPDCLKCDKKIDRQSNPKDATAHALCHKCFWLCKCKSCDSFLSAELMGCGDVCGYCVHVEDIGEKEQNKIVRAFELLSEGIHDVVKAACEKEPSVAGPMAMLLRQMAYGSRFKFCRGCDKFNGELIPQLGGLCEPCSENRMLDGRYARRGVVCRGVTVSDFGERGIESDSGGESSSDESDSSESDGDSDQDMEDDLNNGGNKKEKPARGEMFLDDEDEDEDDDDAAKKATEEKE